MIAICLQACMLQVRQEVVTLTVSFLMRTTAMSISEYGKLRKYTQKSDFLECLLPFAEPSYASPVTDALVLDRVVVVHMNSPDLHIWWLLKKTVHCKDTAAGKYCVKSRCYIWCVWREIQHQARILRFKKCCKNNEGFC